LGPLGAAATSRPTVSAPGDYDDEGTGGILWQGKPKYSEKTFPNAGLSTTNPTCCPDANAGRHGGKPAINRLSYGTALRTILFLASLSEFLYTVLRKQTKL
jgi:hypothetical protein